MALLSTSEILERLREAAKRMREVRSAALELRSIRAGGEPNPAPLPIDLSQPGPGFRGEPIRTNTPTA
ncbi:hypothetical protein LCGC14_1416260 [marine sediment metagenome]|uniref:Uncharacterized protein n=1 Tax=marine sediment metagenome TaxID=412755 RepID=A0A0F9M8A0_9ZZZZ